MRKLLTLVLALAVAGGAVFWWLTIPTVVVAQGGEAMEQGGDAGRGNAQSSPSNISATRCSGTSRRSS